MTASHGGARKGAGRKKGAVASTTKAKRKLAHELLKDGDLSPLEYMLKIMRDEKQPTDKRFAAAKESAPYLHPRLAAVEHSGTMTISHEQALEQIANISNIAGVTDPEDERPNGLTH